MTEHLSLLMSAGLSHSQHAIVFGTERNTVNDPEPSLPWHLVAEDLLRWRDMEGWVW